MTKKDIISLIEKDAWMMRILKTVKELQLPDWWIGAGFVRSKIWDTLHKYKRRTLLPDIDVIYLDKTDFSPEEEDKFTTKSEEKYQKILKKKFPNIHWSVTNQARMHIFHKDKPYKSSEEALAQWVETATCVGVRLNDKNKIILSTPRGIKDLTNLILHPTQPFKDNLKVFYERIEKKQWLKKWPKLKII